MSKEKDSQGFVWLHEWSDNAENFDDAQLASFCRAMFAAAQGKEYTIPDDPLAQLAFKYANRDRERMQDFKKKQSKNGENGGAPKGNKNASKQTKNNPKTTEEQPKNNPKQTQRQRQRQYQSQLQEQPQEGGEGIAPAPDGFDFETYGIMENVKLKPSQYRHLVESYGEEATNQTLDEFSCKLADGSTDSGNHYATLTYWLSYQQKTNGVPLSSKTATQTPTYTPPKQERELTDTEKAILEEWKQYTAQPRQRSEKYDKLKEISERHGGIAPEVLTALGMIQHNGRWLFN